MTSKLDPQDEFGQRLCQVLGEDALKVTVPGRCWIFKLDCIESMEKLAKAGLGGLVQSTVTSPPYCIGKEFEALMGVSVTPDEYVEWTRRWVAAVRKMTTENGALWINLGYVTLDGKAKALPLPYLVWQALTGPDGFYFMQEVIWAYTNGVAARKRFSPRNEKVLWLLSNPNDYVFELDPIRVPAKYIDQKRNGKFVNNQLGKNPSDVWTILKVNGSAVNRTAHPTQYPNELVERCLGASTPKNSVKYGGSLVLDPFMGSGTTAEQALRQGQRVIGFELRDDYCDIIRERLKVFLDDDDEANNENVTASSNSNKIKSEMPRKIPTNLRKRPYEEDFVPCTLPEGDPRRPTKILRITRSGFF